MFKRDYSFWGTHARKVEMLTDAYSEDGVFKLFQRNVDVYMIAPIIGFLFGRRAEEDKTDGMEKKIAGGTLVSNLKVLEYNYRLIMLLDNNYENDLNKRLDKAFRFINTDDGANDKLHYESYVRGGIDVLFEKTFDSATDEIDYINKVYDFLEDFNERYMEIDNQINDLAELARN